MATSLINTECKRYGCMKNLLACYANCRYSGRCDDLRNEIQPNLEQAANDVNAYRRERELSAIEIQLLKRGVKFVDVAALQKNLAQGKKRSVKASPSKKAKVKTAELQAVPEKNKAKTEVLRPVPEKARVKTVELKLVPEKAKVKTTALKAVPEKAETKAAKIAITRKPKKLKKTKAATRVERPQALAQKRVEPVIAMTVGENRELPAAKKNAVVQEKPRTVVKKKTKAKVKKSILKSETRFKMAKKTNDSETGNTMEANQLSAESGAEKAAAPKRKKSPAQDAAAKKKKKMFIVLDGDRSALVDEKGLMAKLLAGVSPNARYFEATEIELRLQIAHKK